MLIVFLCGCIDNQKREQQYCKMFDAEASDKCFVLQKNQTVKALFETLMKKCDENNVDYTGNYIIPYDCIKKQFLFSDMQHTNKINLEIQGFLCPNTSKNIFYDELLIQWETFFSNSSLQLKVKEHIKRTIGMQSHPYLINIVVPDTIYVHQLQEIFIEVLEGYKIFYEEALNVGVDSVLDQYPFRVRITPESFYQKAMPMPPPTNVGL